MTEDVTKELEIARRELTVARKELEATQGRGVSGASLVTLICSALSVASVVAVAVITWTASSDVERLKLQAQLINKALERPTREEAADYLKFLVKVKLLKDQEGGISQYTNDPQTLPLAPPYTPSDVEWYRGLQKSAVFKTANPQRACNLTTIEPVNRSESASQCAQTLSGGSPAYEGVIGSKLVIWWPPVFGSWPACACTPIQGYEPSTTRAFP